MAVAHDQVAKTAMSKWGIYLYVRSGRCARILPAFRSTDLSSNTALLYAAVIVRSFVNCHSITLKHLTVILTLSG